MRKTYKLYIGGKFPRSESGRVEAISSSEGALIANIAKASKKDLRNAVVSARKAQSNWDGSSAYLKGQILYRLAEMLEGRKAQFINSLLELGKSEESARNEVEEAIDAIVYLAGWSDKFQAIYSSVNPVSSPHYNFSVPVSVGVVGLVLGQSSSLLDLVAQLSAIIVGGNTVLIVVPSSLAMISMELAEVIHTSDVPGGVVNVLTGDLDDMVPTLAGHMDVNAVSLVTTDDELKRSVRVLGAENVKRVVCSSSENETLSPYPIFDFQEVKTTWHPIS